MRFIGIRHRVKQTAEGKAKPTQIAVLQDRKTITCNLGDEMQELLWAFAQFPTKFRKIALDEDLAKFLPFHIKWRKLREDEDPKDFPEHLLKQERKTWFVASKVASEFDGLKSDDTVAMILGGSGDRLAFALSRRAEEINARVLRIPAFRLKEKRQRAKEEDALSLAELVRDLPGVFYLVEPRDRKLILVRECLQARIDAMKARIACEQRLRQNLIGRIFCREEGLFPEGSIEARFDEAKANDTIFNALATEEKAREKELLQALKELDIYNELFEPIVACGPMIAARLIASIQDIRRFETPPQLKAFCGTHVLPDGKFARQRRGAIANWHPDARQALFLLGKQFNYRPDSYWGKKLREYKKKLRQAHPEVEIGPKGKKRYTDAHIHKMALWRTRTKFVEWLFREWWKIERQHQQGK